METKELRKKLIISADDFDSDLVAKNKILQLAEIGKLDRVGIMVDENFSDEEVRRLLRSGIKIDLHLVTAADKDNHHKFGESALKRSFLFMLRYFSGKFGTAKMELEWERQLSEFEKKFGRKPDGINSHQHIHYFPPYFKIVLELAKKHNLDFVRFGLQGLLQSNNNVYRILYWLQKKNKRAFRASELKSSDYMVSLDWVKNFDAFLEKLPNGKTELVVHPERKEEFDLIQKNF